MSKKLAASLGIGKVTADPVPSRADMEALLKDLAACHMEHLQTFPKHEAAQHLMDLANRARKLLEG